MARGGARPGAGRKKGGRDRVRPEAPAPRYNVTTPLEYMLAVIADENADPRLRLDAAKNAAPYVHAKLAPKPVETDEHATAAKAAQESGWDSLLPN